MGLSPMAPRHPTRAPGRADGHDERAVSAPGLTCVSGRKIRWPSSRAGAG